VDEALQVADAVDLVPGVQDGITELRMTLGADKGDVLLTRQCSDVLFAVHADIMSHAGNCWIKRSIGGAKDQFIRNYGGVDTCCLLQWILKWELQRYHCCRCTHLPTHSCGDRDGILSSDCSAHIA